MLQQLMTSPQFLDTRFELPDSGQWAELHSGVPVLLDPPDPEHGTAVLNLSKALAAYVQKQSEGYACFDLGLWVTERPDSIFFPAISYFTAGPRFAESDKDATQTVPSLVVELISSEERRQRLPHKIETYFEHGIGHVWTIDCEHRSARAYTTVGEYVRFSEMEAIEGAPVLPGFEILVCDVFREPEWYR